MSSVGSVRTASASAPTSVSASISASATTITTSTTSSSVSPSSSSYLVRSSVAPNTPQEQESAGQKSKPFSTEHVRLVREILRKQFAGQKPLEKLIFEVNLYVDDPLPILYDRNEFITEAVLELPKIVFGNDAVALKFPSPDEVTMEYVDNVKNVLTSRGRAWIESLVQRTSTLSPSTPEIAAPLVGAPAQVMTEGAYQTPITPNRNSTVVGLADTNFDETTTNSMPPEIIFGRQSILYPARSRVHVASYDNEGLSIITDVRVALRNKFLRLWIVAVILVVLYFIVLS